jgi:predicted nucleotidyltransferase
MPSSAQANPSKDLVPQTVQEFERRLRERFGDQLLSVRLFGSFARGTANEDSDVDVFVLLANASYRERRDVLDLASDLFLETELLLSPTIFDRDTYLAHRRQERPLVMAIERDGIPS